MHDVRIRKSDLREVIQKNRDAHRAEFEAALEGFRQQAIARLDQMIADAKAGREFQLVVGLTKPSDHTKDYDRVLRMLDMSVDDEIELSESHFENYVMDEWGWTPLFKATNSTYTVSS